MASKLKQAEQLVGLPYVERTFDCAHLAVLAQERLFGRCVAQQLPAVHPAGIRGASSWMRRYCLQMAEPVAEPVDGDAVLFTEDDGRGGRRWHIGTVLLRHSERWVLHTSANLGASLLQTLADCALSGLAVEGFYRWREAEHE